MGRYTNVQSYSDDSPSMRIVSYEQATGGAAATTSDPPSRDTNELQQEPPRQLTTLETHRHGEQPPPQSQSSTSGGAREEENMAGEECNDVAKSSQLKSDEAEEPQQQQQGQRSSSAISPPSCDTNSLFVGGLHPRIADVHLQKLFSPYGEIARINIVTHNPNDSKSNAHSKSATSAKYASHLQQSKGYAFVEYTNIESARLAMSRLNGRQLMGRSLAVRPSKRKMGEGGGRLGGDSGKAGTKFTPEEARREYGAVESKIEAVKRAIEQKKKGV